MNSNNALLFRRAKIEDIDSILQIEKDGSNLWNKNSFLSELGINFSIFVVAEKNNEIIGFAVAWKIPEEIQINNIAIKKEYRRKQVATQMMNRLILIYKNEMPAHTLKKLFLELKKSNISALQFYKKYGLKKNGIRKKYYGDEDAILMEKCFE